MPGVEQQIKEGFEKVNNEFHTFKQENDARLKKIEEKGAAGGDVEAKIDKHNDAIDKLVAQVEDMKTTMNRANSGHGDEKKDDKKVQTELKGICTKLMRKGSMILSDDEIKFYNENMPQYSDYKGLIRGNDQEGGYFVRPEMATSITTKIFESSPIRQVADVISIGSDAWEEPADFDEPDGAWAGEQTSVSETDNNQVRLLRVPAHELRANPRASQQVLEDAFFDIEAWHANKVSEKFGRMEATAFVGGDGNLKPRGMTTYADGTAYGQVEQVASGQAGSVTADGIIALYFALFDAYQANASWLAHRLTVKEIRKLKDGEGQYLWSMAGNLTDGVLQTLMGKPLRWASDFATPATDSLSMAYGDFRQGYVIVDRVGISVLRDPFSAKPHVEFYTRKRVGGAVRNFQAIKLLKLSAS